MRLKLDENFDLGLVPLVAEGGHEVDTVAGEGLSGKPDDAIYQACRSTGCVLVTLDLDFSNPLRFPPGDTEGVVVVRPPRPILPLIRATIASALPELKLRQLRGRLWIIEPGRVRMYEPGEETERQGEEPRS